MLLLFISVSSQASQVHDVVHSQKVNNQLWVHTKVLFCEIQALKNMLWRSLAARVQNAGRGNSVIIIVRQDSKVFTSETGNSSLFFCATPKGERTTGAFSLLPVMNIRNI
ncbi:hypothetical protein NPIL_592551 [Nephila pilipes]|uniref:Uncharacterized protein n=1 Tax=Nephila pilipes TaxID=299642 RepID=A0A8X6QCH0_NEPPI|nr:hypothetical protein NPIL_592551 [Nephila pilipes]